MKQESIVLCTKFKFCPLNIINMIHQTEFLKQITSQLLYQELVVTQIPLLT